MLPHLIKYDKLYLIIVAQIIKGIKMKKILSLLSLKYENMVEKPVAQKAMAIVNKHPRVCTLLLLGVLCWFFLFYGLNFYPLLDVDETRYAIMARDLAYSYDWNLLMLNGEIFLEKPPLYFWLVAASIKMFGYFGEFVVRFPIALLSSFVVFFTYFVGEKVISRKFGMISAIVLLTSVFFLMLSHIALLDMVLTVFLTSAIYCGFLTHFCEPKYKKYLWWYFYLFVGAGVLAKGLLALVIPTAVIFVYNLLTKTVKDIFKPIHIIPGLLILLAVSLPWHIYLYNIYGMKFINEYFLLHHFSRFTDSANIGRERPLLYFVPIFIGGFMPWTFIFFAFLYDGFKKLVAKFKIAQGNFFTKLIALFSAENNEQKLVLFASIYFLVVFALFSVSSTKLPTYILPVFPAAALLTGYFWYICDEKNENQKAISIATHFLAAIFIVGAFVATFVYYFIPENFQSQIDMYKDHVLVGFYIVGILMLLRLNAKRALSVFAGYVLTMIFVTTVAVVLVFNVIYKGGEHEIVKYSQCATANNAQLITFDFAVKPSAMMYYGKKVHYITDADFNALDKKLGKKKHDVFVIVKNKNLNDANYKKEIQKRLTIYKAGERYSLYSKKKGQSYIPMVSRGVGYYDEVNPFSPPSMP